MHVVPPKLPLCLSTGMRRGEKADRDNLEQGTGKANDSSEPLENAYENIDDTVTPPEPTLTRRAASCSDFYRVVTAQLAKDGGAQRKKTPGSIKDRSWEALTLCAQTSVIEAHDRSDPVPTDLAFAASQQEYLYDSGE